MKTILEDGERPIVSGTDFSATAIEAVDVAAELARRLKVKLILVHVQEYHGRSMTDPGLFEQVVGHNRQELHRHAERLRKLGTKVDEKIRSGSIFNELVDAAAGARARLIVVGAVGHGLARRLIVGSVAERVAETSAIPTLVVRPGSRLASWLRGQQALKILIGYDFTAAGDAALAWLNEWQTLGRSEACVIHLDWPPDEARRFKYDGPLPLTQNPEGIQKVLERNLAERVARFLPEKKVTVVVQPGWGRTDAYLFERAYRDKFDLIVVGTHRRHGLARFRFGSVSRSVLHRSNATVAVIPQVEKRSRASVRKLVRS